MGCNGVFKLNSIPCNLPLFLRQFPMHTMPKNRSMLLPICYKKTNLLLNKTNSIITQIASTTIRGIILNLTTLHALAISHHHAVLVHLATHPQHAQISIHTTHNTYNYFQSQSTTTRCSHKHTTCTQSLLHHMPQLSLFWAHDGQLSLNFSKTTRGCPNSPPQRR